MTDDGNAELIAMIERRPLADETDASRERLAARLAPPTPPTPLPPRPPQARPKRSGTIINPEVSIAWKQADEAAWRANRAAGRLFWVRPPSHEEIARELGVELYVRRGML
jgi:hypothetical protein